MEAGDPHRECPGCGGRRLYAADDVVEGGRRGPTLLPGLGSLFLYAKFEVVVCADCGLTRFFASRQARERLSDSTRWRAL